MLININLYSGEQIAKPRRARMFKSIEFVTSVKYVVGTTTRPRTNLITVGLLTLKTQKYLNVIFVFNGNYSFTTNTICSY